jgi:hypothetical protein
MITITLSVTEAIALQSLLDSTLQLLQEEQKNDTQQNIILSHAINYQLWSVQQAVSKAIEVNKCQTSLEQ